MANINLIITEILSLQGADEINSAVKEINSALKVIRGRDLREMKYQFKIGDSVIVDNPRDGYRVFGTILKIKRTKAEIDMDGVKWNVPITAMRHSS
tara:strand:- start:48 stop:335 length:288 start_codon:yes stop_codon:yes gene_type:complete